jgi:hypothetical protein
MSLVQLGHRWCTPIVKRLVLITRDLFEGLPDQGVKDEVVP